METTKFKICLAKKMIIFYSFLALIIIPASIYNLIGFINHTSSVVHLGVFSLFGFIVLPLLLFATYRNKLCTIKSNEVTIGKATYSFANHKFSIEGYDLKWSERPIVSLLQKTYFRLVITETKTNEEVFSEDLDITKKEIKKIEALLPK